MEGRCKYTEEAVADTEVALQICREVGFQVNTDKTKYMVKSRHQNVGQNHDLLTANKSLKMWQNSSTNIWEQHIEIAFTKKLRAD
jgi:hypothetical protein